MPMMRSTCRALVLVVVAYGSLSLLTTYFPSSPVYGHGSVPAQSLLAGTQECLEPGDRSERIECYRRICALTVSCGESLVVSATEIGGPDSGNRVIADFLGEPSAQAWIDAHQLAHLVGRQTAKHFGFSGDAFLRCSSDFADGCKHGFFEEALSQFGSSLHAASSICDGVSSAQQIDCYHGIGHGLMMANAYKLYKSLSQCTQLPRAVHVEGCAAGVFMEHDNAILNNTILRDPASTQDPLAPCDQVEPSLRKPCYSNHGGYLLSVSRNSIERASELCLGAGESALVSACIVHLGQHASLPDWQIVFLGDRRTDQVHDTLSLCDLFPQDYRRDCRRGGLQNLLIYNYTDQAVAFCRLLSPSETAQCFGEIRKYIRLTGRTSDVAKRLCSGDEKELQQTCDVGTLAFLRRLFAGGLFGPLFGIR